MRRRDNHQFDLSEEDRRLRVRKVDSLLAQIIQERLARGIADPRFRGLVSITGVEVSPDLREATVRFSVLPAQYGVRVLSALKSARGLLKREIRNESSLKRVPELTFQLDTTLKHDAALADAIRSGIDDDKNEEDRERPDAIDS